MGGVLVEHVVPILGAMVGNAMFLSPMKTVLRMRAEGVIGEVNPLPYPVIFCNCCSWMVYAVMTTDYYLFMANLLGACFGMWFTLSAYGVAPTKLRFKLEVIMLLLIIVVSACGLVVGISVTDAKSARSIQGIVTVGILVVYYGAPLSTTAKVIVTRNAASLHLPMSVMNLVNGLLWTTYGFAMNDHFLWGPNMAGAFLASFQLLLITVFGVARRLGWHEPDFRGLKASKSAEAGISTLGDDPGGSITPLGAQV